MGNRKETYTVISSVKTNPPTICTLKQIDKREIELAEKRGIGQMLFASLDCGEEEQ